MRNEASIRCCKNFLFESEYVCVCVSVQTGACLFMHEKEEAYLTLQNYTTFNFLQIIFTQGCSTTHKIHDSVSHTHLHRGKGN
jgi:hypothetical protein